MAVTLRGTPGTKAGTTATSDSVTIPSTQAGNTLVLCFSGRTTATSPLTISGTPSGGGTWTQLKQSTAGVNGTSKTNNEIWIAKNISGSVTTINFNLVNSGSAGFYQVVVAEFTGLGTAPTLDTSNTNHSAATDTVTTGAVIPTNKGDLIVASTCFTAGTPGFTSGPINSYSTLPTALSTRQQSAYLVPGSVASTSTGWTFTGSTEAWDACIVAIEITLTSTQKTITGISRITNSTDQTITGISRIAVTTDQTITGISRIAVTTQQTITGVSRIQITTNQTITGISRITATTDQTITGVSRIQITTNQTITGVANIVTTSDQTITGVARIQITTDQTITGVANILQTTDQTITGVSRIQVTTDQTITGIARIAVTTDQTITGIARIEVTTDQTITGVANILQTTDQTITGIARIQVTTDQTITGVADIRQTTDQTITGISRIAITTDQTQTGIARITIKTQQHQTGKGNVRATTNKTQTGKAAIRVTTQQTISGVANITTFVAVPTLIFTSPPNSQTITGLVENLSTPASQYRVDIYDASASSVFLGTAVLQPDFTFSFNLPRTKNMLGKAHIIKP